MAVDIINLRTFCHSTSRQKIYSVPTGKRAKVKIEGIFPNADISSTIEFCDKNGNIFDGITVYNSASAGGIYAAVDGNGNVTHLAGGDKDVLIPSANGAIYYSELSCSNSICLKGYHAVFYLNEEDEIKVYVDNGSYYSVFILTIFEEDI